MYMLNIYVYICRYICIYLYIFIVYNIYIYVCEHIELYRTYSSRFAASHLTLRRKLLRGRRVARRERQLAARGEAGGEMGDGKYGKRQEI